MFVDIEFRGDLPLHFTPDRAYIRETNHKRFQFVYRMSRPPRLERGLLQRIREARRPLINGIDYAKAFTAACASAAGQLFSVDRAALAASQNRHAKARTALSAKSTPVPKCSRRASISSAAKGTGASVDFTNSAPSVPINRRLESSLENRP